MHLTRLPRRVWLIFAACSTAGAQLPAEDIFSLSAAIQVAKTTHPVLASYSNRVSAAESGVVQARLRPNPRLYLQSENLRSWDGQQLVASQQIDNFAYLSQPFETGAKRSRRTTVAELAVRSRELERELAERQVVARVKQAYWAAAGAARIEQASRQNLDNFRQIVDYHDKRVREGALPEADLLKVQLEGERLRLAANTAALEAERARIELFRAMGQTEFPAIRFDDSIGPPSTPPVADIESALAERTEVKLARNARQEALANVELQRAMGKPDIDLVFGYKHTVGLPTVLGGVQYSLPFSNRNQGAIGAAQASVKVADAEIAASQAIVRAEITSAAADARIRRSQVFETLPKLRAQAEESAAIALAAYREGGSDLLRLLDAQRVRIEVETLYYRTVSEYRQSIAALETAMGVE